MLKGKGEHPSAKCAYKRPEQTPRPHAVRKAVKRQLREDYAL